MDEVDVGGYDRISEEFVSGNKSEIICPFKKI
jgi:hypothetical protein